jgi:hypothetical protein
MHTHTCRLSSAPPPPFPSSLPPFFTHQRENTGMPKQHHSLLYFAPTSATAFYIYIWIHLSTYIAIYIKFTHNLHTHIIYAQLDTYLSTQLYIYIYIKFAYIHTHTHTHIHNFMLMCVVCVTFCINVFMHI